MDPNDTQQPATPQSGRDDLPGSDEPDDVTNTLPDDHPATDTNVDPTEKYDEGLDGAAEAEEPQL